ncbi:hypothetical protein HELRODRAFT_169997 [Helobdella robusta]|uniref:Uncharacterized protein n=1 Tax=Helobdella robusta TaxID=6412 RepID=T1F2I5_HELRO|nr:hypothetical protein HELRODRAFT_169997 [Helobdella robusta]ESO07471.1 hypothetical protein HELRODRAFT_169997 [Helobdella robusta]
MERVHHQPLTRNILDPNTTILDYEPDPVRLKIKEALHINKHKPSLNKQYNSFDHTLQLFSQYHDLTLTVAVGVDPQDLRVPQRYKYHPTLNTFQPINTQFVTQRHPTTVIASLDVLCDT